MNIVYRFANIDDKDAKEIAYVSAKSWYDTYQNIMPMDYLKDRLDNLNQATINTKKFLENAKNYLVCEIDKKVVGICYYSDSKKEEYKNYGYLEALYLLKKYQGLGIGKEMFKKAVQGLIDEGYNKMYLECAVGNDTINFYKKYGGKVVDTTGYHIKNFSIFVDIIVFDDLNKTLKLLNEV